MDVFQKLEGACVVVCIEGCGIFLEMAYFLCEQLPHQKGINDPCTLNALMKVYLSQLCLFQLCNPKPDSHAYQKQNYQHQPNIQPIQKFRSIQWSQFNLEHFNVICHWDESCATCTTVECLVVIGSFIYFLCLCFICKIFTYKLVITAIFFLMVHFNLHNLLCFLFVLDRIHILEIVPFS